MELAAPSSSFPCRREGVHLLRLGVTPLLYGGLCATQPPLLLATLGALPERRVAPLLLLADVVAALLLLYLSRARRRRPTTGGVVACAMLLLSPWSIAACAAGSSSSLGAICVLMAASLATCGGGGGVIAMMMSAAALALGIGASPDLIWMLPSLAALCAHCATVDGAAPRTALGQLVVALRFASAVALGTCVLCASLAPAHGGAAQLVAGTLGAWLAAAPVHNTPGLGLWWYWMAQVAMPLRASFAAALHTLPRLCVPCLAVRMLPPAARKTTAASKTPAARQRRRPAATHTHGREGGGATTVDDGGEDGFYSRGPLLCVSLSLAVITAVQPAVTVPEVGLAIALVASQADERLLSRTRYLPVALTSAGLGLSGSRAWLGAWLGARTLNANFAYFGTSLLGGGLLLAVYDLAAAALHADAHEEAERAARTLQARVRRRRRRAARAD